MHCNHSCILTHHSSINCTFAGRFELFHWSYHLQLKEATMWPVNFEIDVPNRTSGGSGCLYAHTLTTVSNPPLKYLAACYLNPSLQVFLFLNGLLLPNIQLRINVSQHILATANAMSQSGVRQKAMAHVLTCFVWHHVLEYNSGVFSHTIEFSLYSQQRNYSELYRPVTEVASWISWEMSARGLELVILNEFWHPFLFKMTTELDDSQQMHPTNFLMRPCMLNLITIC